MSYPIIASTDVVVVGGGPSGLAAAIAASRTGAKTILIEKYGFLGGMATAGLVGPFMTSYNTTGQKQIVKGIFEEIIQRLGSNAVHPSRVGHKSPYASYIDHISHDHVCPFDVEALKQLAFEMIEEENIGLMLHTFFVDSVVENNQIQGVCVATKQGLGVVMADIVIDTTGDGDVSVASGANFEKGRFGDGKLQPVSMFFRIGGVDDIEVEQWVKANPDEKLFQSILEKHADEFPSPRYFVGLYKTLRAGYWLVNTSRLHDIDGTVPSQLTHAEIEGRKQVHELMEFFNIYLPGLENAFLDTTATQIGIRETRRIMGHYKLTADDIYEARTFEDVVARYSFPMDIHDPDGRYGRLDAVKSGKGTFYEIPYRCLVPKNTSGLLVAGRCISASHEAIGSARVMPACFATGQAAGVAGALCVQHGTIPSELDVREIQRELTRQDAL